MGDQVGKLKKSDTDSARDVLVIGGKVYAFLQPKRGQYELTHPPGRLVEVDESAIEALSGSEQPAATDRVEKPMEESTPESDSVVGILRSVVDAASDLERTEALWNLATFGEGDEAALASRISNKSYRASLHRAVTLKGLRDLLQ
jgi:hypothetical protein